MEGVAGKRTTVALHRFSGGFHAQSPKMKIEAIPHLREFVPDVPAFENPLMRSEYFNPVEGFFVTETDMIMENIVINIDSPAKEQVFYHRAGPRSKVCFEPREVRAAIATCGGLCPGLNTVIRELIYGLWFQYGVRDIKGIRAGYRGFYSREPLALYPKMAHLWHKIGGTVLETSRGGFDVEKIVDAIERYGFNQVYLIGGDGTMRGAAKVFEEVRRRGLKVCVAGIPGNVDNDMGVIDKSFGFQTAVESAQSAISAAAVEADSAINGVGLVRLMGRQTGHIALHSTLGSRDVDCCLIPEDPFYLEGEGGLFQLVERRLAENGRFVLVVAEGAGKDLMPPPPKDATADDDDDEFYDMDVGPWLSNELKGWWKKQHPDEQFTLKYIEPTCMLRDAPANATENHFCTLLANSCMHGVMAGYTGFVVGSINGMYAYVPLQKVAATNNFVDNNDPRWAWVRSVTNQPDFVCMRKAQD
uniref:TSA: Wollemia nobilis Ref_Wollemi_Transcript_14138_1838 transcribed RNA sequence n=1 Tax=Wollemia nobilis TaxID=56998 RepID=A0A0C9S6Y4_9CONI